MGTARKQSVFRLTLPSTSKAISRVEPYLKKITKALKLDEIQHHKLMISVTEAVNNGIIHGNRSNPERKVTVRSEVHPDWLIIIICDQGKGFNPDAIRNPLKRENLMLQSGRGIFLMRTLMDKVEFNSTKEGAVVQLWLALARG